MLHRGPTNGGLHLNWDHALSITGNAHWTKPYEHNRSTKVAGGMQPLHAIDRMNIQNILHVPYTHVAGINCGKTHPIDPSLLEYRRRRL